MNYWLSFHPAVKKDLRRVDIKAREQIISFILPQLVDDPFQGLPLAGPLRGIWKYRVFISSVWYRIAYTINTKQKELTILAVGPRGSFYSQLRRRIKK